MKYYLFILVLICLFNSKLIGQTSNFSVSFEEEEHLVVKDSIQNAPVLSTEIHLDWDNEAQGIDEFTEGIVVYPNPVSGKLTIDLKEYYGPVVVRIYDIDLGLLNISKERNVDMASYKQGVYLLEVEYDGHIEVMRVIKN